MRSARHLGKIVATASPLAQGRLRSDRSYLVTGGLGGIGRAVAGMACRPWRRNNRAQWAPGAGRGRRGNDPQPSRTRGERRRGTGGRHRHRCARPNARPYRSESASLGGRDSQRRRLVGRRPHQPELDEIRAGPLAEDPGGLALASRDRAIATSTSSFSSRAASGSWAIRDRRITPSANAFLDQLAGSPPRDGAPGAGHCMGGLVRDRRGGRAEGTGSKGSARRWEAVGSPRSRA